MQVPSGAEERAKQDAPSAAGAVLQQNAARQHSAAQASLGEGTRLEAHCRSCLPARYSYPSLQAGTRLLKKAGGMMLDILTRACSDPALDVPRPHNLAEPLIAAAPSSHKAALDLQLMIRAPCTQGPAHAWPPCLCQQQPGSSQISTESSKPAPPAAPCRGWCACALNNAKSFEAYQSPAPRPARAPC